MQVGALRPYERSLLTREPLRLRHEDGCGTQLDIDRWLAPADAADLTVVARAGGPALDVGCGPGRIVAALAERRLLCLGVDIAATAVALTRARGLNALRRNVFARLPGEGRWVSVILLDGNIGIGGDPGLLLARVRSLLAPSGSALVETHADPETDEQVLVRFARSEAPLGPAFPWAHVGSTALRRYAAETGLVVTETWQLSGRSFAALRVAD